MHLELLSRTNGCDEWGCPSNIILEECGVKSKRIICCCRSKPRCRHWAAARAHALRAATATCRAAVACPCTQLCFEYCTASSTCTPTSSSAVAVCGRRRLSKQMHWQSVRTAWGSAGSGGEADHVRRAVEAG